MSTIWGVTNKRQQMMPCHHVRHHKRKKSYNIRYSRNTPKNFPRFRFFLTPPNLIIFKLCNIHFLTTTLKFKISFCNHKKRIPCLQINRTVQKKNKKTPYQGKLYFLNFADNFINLPNYQFYQTAKRIFNPDWISNCNPILVAT